MENLFLRETLIGRGVFANKDFKKFEEIIKFRGKLFTREQLPILYDDVSDHYVQIDRNLYMGPSGCLDDFINHSCEPNSGLKIMEKRVFLIAIKDIKIGEEVTWDYSTTMDEDEWEMDCLCKRDNCRKRIRDFKYLSKSIQQYYIQLNVVPNYILEKLKCGFTIQSEILEWRRRPLLN